MGLVGQLACLASAGGRFGGPTICVTGDRVLGQVDIQRVLDIVGQRLLRGGTGPEIPVAG